MSKMKEEVRKKIAAINRQDVVEYLDNQEKHKDGVLKDHLHRYLDLEMKRNEELRKELKELWLERTQWAFEKDVLETEIRRLKGILEKRNFKIV